MKKQKPLMFWIARREKLFPHIAKKIGIGTERCFLLIYQRKKIHNDNFTEKFKEYLCSALGISESVKEELYTFMSQDDADSFYDKCKNSHQDIQ